MVYLVVGAGAAPVIAIGLALWRARRSATDPSQWPDDPPFKTHVRLLKAYMRGQGWKVHEPLAWAQVFVHCSRDKVWLAFMIQSRHTLSPEVLIRDFIDRTSDRRFVCGVLSREAVTDELRNEAGRYGIFIISPEELGRLDEHVQKAHAALRLMMQQGQGEPAPAEAPKAEARPAAAPPPRPAGKPAPSDPDGKDVASRFESLGGGSCDRLNNPYGSEFALFARRMGVETMGLLRWTSIHPDRLIRAVEDGFAGVEDPEKMVMNPGTRDWNAVQVSCGIFNAHTGLSREAYTSEEASRHFARTSIFLRDKLLRDFERPDKIFVYRTADTAMPEQQVMDLARAIARRGPGKLLYVRRAAPDEAPFQVVLRRENLLVATIDRFSNPSDPNQHNDKGWLLVCRAALAGLPDSSNAAHGDVAGAAGATTGAPAVVVTPNRGAASAIPEARPATPLSAQAAHDLVTQFEGIGADCEFGLVQRKYRADPLGLLRWSSVRPEVLAQLLKTRFEGFTNDLSLYQETWGEYFVKNTRLQINIHTWQKTLDVSEAEFLAKQRTRLAWLVEKMLENLAAADRIYVYKLRNHVFDAHMEDVAANLRRYADNRFLCVEVADATHPTGLVEMVSPGFMRGFISRQGANPGVGWNIAFEDWLEVCQRALAM